MRLKTSCPSMPGSIMSNEIDRLVGGHLYPVLAVIGGQSSVAVSCEPALEEPRDTRVVFDDQHAHGIRQYNRVPRRFTARTEAILGEGSA